MVNYNLRLNILKSEKCEFKRGLMNRCPYGNLNL